MDNLRELQLVELSILKDTLRLFEKHGISYYALGGTMLGAVRHKGFIPWDDDIDIGVPREDYNRLPALKDSFPPELKLHSYRDDPTYPYYFSRVENERIIVCSNRAETDEYTPAWIDIFPLDGMPNTPIRRKLHGYRILLSRMLFQISRFDTIVNIRRTNRPLGEKLIIGSVRTLHLQNCVSRRGSFRFLDKTLNRFPYATSSHQINAMGAYKLREMFDKRVFGDGAMYSFEDIQIRGPQDYETYLTQLYGDWRTPADMTHHSVVGITKRDEPTE